MNPTEEKSSSLTAHLVRKPDVFDPCASEVQLEELYSAMKRRAKMLLTMECGGERLQTTALVHEAYLRVHNTEIRWQSTQHFMNTISTAMRRVLVDQARSRLTIKRNGGNRKHLTMLDPILHTLSAQEVIEIHDALEFYASHEPTKAKLIELRIFAGLSLAAAADVLDISPATAKRYWAIAKLQLARLLGN